MARLKIPPMDTLCVLLLKILRLEQEDAEGGGREELRKLLFFRERKDQED